MTIENVIKHFKEKSERKCFDVKEWGEEGKPLRIFVDPMTMKQKQEFLQASKKGESAGAIHLITHKALNQDGQRMFWGEKLMLMNQADPSVVERVGLTILILSSGRENFPEIEDESMYKEIVVKKN